MVLLLVGHALLLMAPDRVLRWDASPTGLSWWKAAGFSWAWLRWPVSPSVCGGTWAPRAGRAPRDRRRGISLLAVAGVDLWALHGRAISLGVVVGAATVAPYAHSLWQRRPAPSLIAEIPFSARLHVTAALAAVATAPTSRLGAALVLGAWRALGAAGAAAETGARGLVGWLRPQRLFALLWPEDDLMDLARLSRRHAQTQRLSRKAGQAAASPARPMEIVGALPMAPARTDNDVEPPPLSAEGGG